MGNCWTRKSRFRAAMGPLLNRLGLIEDPHYKVGETLRHKHNKGLYVVITDVVWLGEWNYWYYSATNPEWRSSYNEGNMWRYEKV